MRDGLVVGSFCVLLYCEFEVVDLNSDKFHYFLSDPTPCQTQGYDHTSMDCFYWVFIIIIIILYIEF